MARHRYLLIATLILGAGLSLHLPSLQTGFFADDYTYQLIMRGLWPDHTLPAWNMFDFGDVPGWQGHDPGPWTKIWWTAPDWQTRFFRPLTSGLFWLEHATWGENSVGYHVTSLFLYGVLLGLALAVYRALGLGRRSALIALAFYAATSCGVFPVGWIANVNTVLATLLTLSAVLAVARLRGRWRLPVALTLAVLAFGAKESGLVAPLVVSAYLALEAHRAPVGPARRQALIGSILALSVAGGLLAAYILAGYGTRCLLYATPWINPGLYLQRLAVLFTAGLLRLVVPVGVDLVYLVPATAIPLCVTAAVVMLIVGRYVWRRVSPHPAALFLAAWIFLSLLLEGSVLSSDRLLFNAAVGSAGLLALFVYASLSQRTAPRRQRALAWAVIVSAGIFSGLLTLFQQFTLAHISRALRTHVLTADPGPATGGRLDCVVLQPGNAVAVLSFNAVHAIAGRRPDARYHHFQFGQRGLEWTRDSETTCLLSSLDEPFLTHFLEGLYLTSSEPPLPETRFETEVFKVEVMASDAEGLHSVRLSFDRPLDSADLRFLITRDGHLASISPPPIGETVTIPRCADINPMSP